MQQIVTIISRQGDFYLFLTLLDRFPVCEFQNGQCGWTPSIDEEDRYLFPLGRSFKKTEKTFPLSIQKYSEIDFLSPKNILRVFVFFLHPNYLSVIKSFYKIKNCLSTGMFTSTSLTESENSEKNSMLILMSLQTQSLYFEGHNR